MLRYTRMFITTGALLSLVTANASAQHFSIGLRGTGGFPMGNFSEASTDGTSNDALINGAKSGFGYGLDLGVGIGALGVYAGFDHINFDCETSTCTNDGKYKLQGVAVGVKLTPPMMSRIHPYVKGGVTFNSLEGVYGNSTSGNKLSTDRAPGYELGAGANISLGGLLALTPQVRYVGQNFKAKIPGVVVPDTQSDGANYVTFDLGLSFVTPFGAKK